MSGQYSSINLQLGWPTPSLFAREGLLAGTQAILSSDVETAQALVYGPHHGHPALRKNLASWLTQCYHPVAGDIDQGRTCITNGASGNLANVLQKFTDPIYTRRIFMVEPTYFLACPIYEDSGFAGKLRGIPEEASEGCDTAFLEKALNVAEQEAVDAGNLDPKMKAGKSYHKIYKYIIYLVPTYSNPSAKTISLNCRRELVRLARKFDALLVTDDVYDFLRWSPSDTLPESSIGDIPPRLVDIDREMPGYDAVWGNTMSNGSFSKIIGPGVRVGWAEATESFVDQLANCGSSSSGGAPSHLTSTFVNHMIDTGALRSHIEQVLIPTYRCRSRILSACIKQYLGPLGVGIESTEASQMDKDGSTSLQQSIGGFFTYIRLPEDLPPARDVAALAMSKYNLKVAYGHMFCVAGDEGSVVRAESKHGFGRCIRLCWAWHTEDVLREGVRRLAEAVIEIRNTCRSEVVV